MRRTYPLLTKSSVVMVILNELNFTGLEKGSGFYPQVTIWRGIFNVKWRENVLQRVSDEKKNSDENTKRKRFKISREIAGKISFKADKSPRAWWRQKTWLVVNRVQ